MALPKSDYLHQYHQQISDLYDLEDLKALAFELGVDWDELAGARKSTRVQELITFLGRHGRLEDLHHALAMSRPQIDWLPVPTPDEQKRDIKTAFPAIPLYKQPWLWLVVLAVLLIAGLYMASRLPSRLATAIVVPTPTPTSLPTATPFPFPPAADGEMLIVIATFARTEGTIDVAAHDEIRRAIQERIDTLGLSGVRVEVEPAIIGSNPRNEAEERRQAVALGGQYGASQLIWGIFSGVRAEVNFLYLNEPVESDALASIQETDRTQIANPEGYSRFIVDELPSQLAFLSLYSLGYSEYTNENYPAAVRFLQEAFATLPAEPNDTLTDIRTSAHFLLGWLLQTQGDLSQSLAEYDQAIVLDPGHINALINRGNVYATLEEFEVAIADYDHVLTLDPENSLALINRGNSHTALAEYDLALADFNRANAIDPDNASVYYNRGSTYFSLGEYESAVADFDRAIALNPADPFNFNNRGFAYAELGEYEKAITDYDRAIALDPTDPFPLNNRGNAYSDIKEYEKALADYDAALALDPEYAFAYYNRGLLYAILDDYELAIADFNQALALDTGFVDAYIERGDAYIELGDFEKAVADYDQVLAIDPENASVTYSRGFANIALGENEKAIQDLERYLELDPDSASRDLIEGIISFLEPSTEN